MFRFQSDRRYSYKIKLKLLKSGMTPLRKTLQPIAIISEYAGDTVIKLKMKSL